MQKLQRFNLGSAIRRVLGIENRPKSESRPQFAGEAERPEITDTLNRQTAVNAEIAEAPQHLLVWMIERDRYGVRGRALCTTVELCESEAVELCDEIRGYVLNAPNGETVVVEARTGGLIGYSLETVQDGVRDMPSSDLIKQIDSGKKEFDRMQQLELSNASFWRALKMSDEEPSSITEYD